MNKDTILGILRHALTFGGGFLTTKGLAGAADIETAVGAAIALIGFAWSIFVKVKKPAP